METKWKKLMFSLLAACLLLTGCEKAVFDDDDSSTPAVTKGNVVLSVSGFEHMKSAARNAVSLTEVCTRLDFAVYKDGERLVNVHQKASSATFGQVELSLAEGDYQVLVIGHSGLGSANPDTKNPANVLFSNLTEKGGGTGYSDTFYYYGNLTVGAGQTSESYRLKRAVAMFRLVTTDAKPADVKRFWFSISGGCKGFDTTEGKGVYNPKQQAPIMFYDLDESYDGKPLQLDVFTFVSAEAGKVNLTVRAMSAANSLGERDILYERVFGNVSMERNTITQYSGAFFGTGEPDNPDEPDTPGNPDNPDNPDNPGDPDDPDDPDTPADPSTCSFLVDTDWGSTHYYTY